MMGGHASRRRIHNIKGGSYDEYVAKATIIGGVRDPVPAMIKWAVIQAVALLSEKNEKINTLRARR